MQDYDVNIICIKTEADIKWNLCGRRQTKESNVHISVQVPIKQNWNWKHNQRLVSTLLKMMVETINEHLKTFMKLMYLCKSFSNPKRYRQYKKSSYCQIPYGG